MFNATTFSYSVYKTTVTIVPLVALSLSLFGTIVTAYAIVLMCWPFRKMLDSCAHKKGVRKFLAQVETEGGKLPCWTCIFGGLKLIYGKEIDELEAKGKPTIYSICGRHVRPWLLAMLFLVVMFVCTCTLIAFWNTFLVDESMTCDMNMDCFAINSTTGNAKTENPLNNCTAYEDDYTIHCYKFVFNYPGALGDAGGVLVLASVIMNVQAGLWVGASSQEGKVWWCAVVAVTTLNIVCSIGLMATPILVFTVPLFRETVVTTSKSQIQFFTYWSTFMCAFLFSGPILMVFSKRLKNETTIFGEEQYVSTVNSRGSVLLTPSLGGEDPGGDSEWKHLSPKSAHHSYSHV